MAAALKIFISHTTSDHRDCDLAHKLAEGLKTWGINVWIAPETIPPGDRWQEAVVTAIMHECTHFLVILSAASVNAPWVLKEISLAKARVENGPTLTVLSLETGKLPEFDNQSFLKQFHRLPYCEQFAAQLRALAYALDLPPALPAISVPS